MNFNQIFAQTFKQMREEKKLSQGDISKFLGWTTAQFVSNWERGLSYPPQKQLEKICFKFDLDYQVLAFKIVHEEYLKLASHWKCDYVKQALKLNMSGSYGKFGGVK